MNPRTWGATVLLFVAGFLIFWNLGAHGPWDDEATTALHGQSVWRRGEAYIQSGHNIVAYQSGILVKDGINKGDPPLQFFLVAPFVGIGGNSMWAARLPFALCGFACVALLVYWLHRDCTDPVTWTLFATGIVTSAALWLYFRQARYYAPAIFLSTLIGFLYLHWDRKLWKLILLGVAMALLLLDHYLIYIACCGCLVVDYLAWQRRRDPLRLRDWLILLTPQIVAALWILIWRLPPTSAALASHQGHNSLFDKLTLLWYELRDMNTDELMPVILLPVALAIAIVTKSLWLRRALTCFIIYLVVIAALAPTSVAKDHMAETRYLAPIIPLCIAIEVLVIRVMWNRSRIAASILAVMIFLTTLLHQLAPSRSINLIPTPLRCTIASFVSEVLHPSADPYRTTARWIATNVAPGESILTLPFHAEYPLMFLQPKAIYAWQIWTDPPPLKNLPDIHFQGRVAPNYVIFFGRNAELTQTWDAKLSALTAYEPAATLDVYCRDEIRPEISWHRFNEVTNFDRQTETIVIWRKRERAARSVEAISPHAGSS